MTTLGFVGLRIPFDTGRDSRTKKSQRRRASGSCRRRVKVEMRGEVGGSRKKIFLSDLEPVSLEALNNRPLQYARVGAYAVFDGADELRYVGYSRNVFAKLRLHAVLQPQACVTFRLYFPAADQDVSPQDLENVLDMWIVQNGKIPSGNTTERELWESPAWNSKPPMPSRPTDPSYTITRSSSTSRKEQEYDSNSNFPRAKPYRRGYDDSSEYDPFDPFSAKRSSSRGKHNLDHASSGSSIHCMQKASRLGDQDICLSQ
uniref:GIY-YIG domain-containing protein n=2 Tax=Rhodosorus marinus TaxID=101924 RepID=A0A7S3EAU3_9RHOD|mmetsp:Transcript_19318/g.77271  ORF Transcript_19318/g.77271 Transcript_19318/m.77271 type:complete len:259 (+) Transcript_19318:121-897(+)|eukprot:CAMPEP_0113973256 /NCGR_PEP_ID=MMETSP0011_2-20120614/14181_1 /TAXON_ID=101924 /ORGANISM="Rhodosorus marinus" /LENGTH=258 /DNA_ID=CAMNT_0000990823 /DNA_START=54 /DNA_END=830 /DNA_ORIENTATION=- /assembly_acc=CAM_ASM_000156